MMTWTYKIDDLDIQEKPKKKVNSISTSVKLAAVPSNEVGNM